MDLSGKLTVKHFLYKDLAKEFPPGKVEKSPVYTRISLDKKQTDFKSNFQSFLINKADFHEEDIKLKSYLTEKDFKKYYENTSTEFGLAIETERKIIWEISDLLRQHNFNIVQKGARVIIDRFMQPIDFAINETCTSILKMAIFSSSNLNENNDSVQKAIYWNTNFVTLYKALAAISKESFLEELVSMFKLPFEIFSHLKEFEKLKGGSESGKSISNLSRVETALTKSQRLVIINKQIMCYQWGYFNLEEEFSRFLKGKGLKGADIDESLSIISYSLNKHFETLENKKITDSVFPIHSQKPAFLRS